MISGNSVYTRPTTRPLEGDRNKNNHQTCLSRGWAKGQKSSKSLGHQLSKDRAREDEAKHRWSLQDLTQKTKSLPTENYRTLSTKARLSTKLPQKLSGSIFHSLSSSIRNWNISQMGSLNVKSRPEMYFGIPWGFHVKIWISGLSCNRRWWH